MTNPTPDPIQDALGPLNRDLEPPQSVEAEEAEIEAMTERQRNRIMSALAGQEEAEGVVVEYGTTTTVTPPPPPPTATGSIASMQDAQERFGVWESMTEYQKTNLPPFPINPAEETLASSMNPPSVTASFTPASPASLIPPPYETLRRFVQSDEFSVDWTRQQVNRIVGNSPWLPSPTSWRMPPMADLPVLVHDVVQAEGYVEAKWPGLAVVMGASVDNVEWTAGVLCFLALVDAIRVLGRVREAMDEVMS